MAANGSFAFKIVAKPLQLLLRA